MWVKEKWLHRAELAEAAINERHASRLWGIPRTNLAVVAWPPHTKERLFYRWHYWWQAHYLDCLVDAYQRQPTKLRRARIADTIRGIRIRNKGRLTANHFYDDKLWLLLALDRARGSRSRRKFVAALAANIHAGIDPVTHVLPWRTGEMFFNVPTNGPAAIAMARSGDLTQARTIIDWVFTELIDDKGLVMDGVRMTMRGPELVRVIYPYCQGVVIGACLEIALRLQGHPSTFEESFTYISHVRSLVHAVARELATPTGVIDTGHADGDGGLFKGILARYLAEVATRLPGDSEANRTTKKIAARLVMASAESLWSHRLEVDGLPVFSSDWVKDAKLPHNYGIGGTSLGDFVNLVRIDERDLSVQLSGWMLLEAAVTVSLDDEQGQ